MIRFLGAVGAALIAMTPLAFAQSCDTNELLGGRGGACLISVKQTTTGSIRTIRPAGAVETTRPVVYSGVSGAPVTSVQKAAGVAVVRGSSQPAPVPVAVVAEAPPTCRFKVRRLTNRRDGEPRFDVCVDDLAALDSREGVEALYNRLSQTAATACPADGRRFTQRLRRLCALSVLEETIEASGIEQLALYHARLRSRDFAERVAIVGPEPR
ncbi:MAG: hypothetical protein AAFW65_07025 [Pseudomonadota bacterium]